MCCKTKYWLRCWFRIRLLEREWVENKDADLGTKLHRRSGEEKVYIQPTDGTYYVLINSIQLNNTIRILDKMWKIHKPFGHMISQMLIKLYDIYDEYQLCYDKYEAKIWAKPGDCWSCKEGKTINSFKKGKINYYMKITKRIMIRKGYTSIVSLCLCDSSRPTVCLLCG